MDLSDIPGLQTISSIITETEFERTRQDDSQFRQTVISQIKDRRIPIQKSRYGGQIYIFNEKYLILFIATTDDPAEKKPAIKSALTIPIPFENVIGVFASHIRQKDKRKMYKVVRLSPEFFLMSTIKKRQGRIIP